MAIQTLDQLTIMVANLRAEAAVIEAGGTSVAVNTMKAAADLIEKLIAVEAERTQQTEEHKDDTRTAATRLVPTPDATAGKD